MKIRSKSGAVLGALIAAGLVSASAATLGGLNSDTLGANDDVVASCDTDGIGMSYQYAYNAASQYYEVTAVDFSGVNAACDTLDASVSLANGTTLLTTEASAGITVTSNAFTITLTTPVQAELVTSASLIIT
jgi:hypothetical protein